MPLPADLLRLPIAHRAHTDHAAAIGNQLFGAGASVQGNAAIERGLDEIGGKPRSGAPIQASIEAQISTDSFTYPGQ